MLGFEGHTERELIHAGSRSRVYRAVRDADGLAVVVKLAAGRHPSPADRRRLQHEFAIGSGLHVAAAVQHVGLEVCGAGLALVMTDFGGRSLDLGLPPGGYDLDEFLTVAIDVAAALEQFHDAGIVHCDIKPGNLLRNRQSGEIRICDFGAARSHRAQTRSETVERNEATLAYLSPEQSRRTSHVLDHRTDLYSLGVTLFELLTGRRPFETDDPLEMLHAHLARQPPSPRALVATIPEVLERIVLRLLAKNPDDRYRSARGLRADLARCRGDRHSRDEVPGFALGSADVSARLLVPKRLFGRDRERGELRDAVARASHGPSHILFIAGYSGVGKSSLVADVQRHVLASGGEYCSGKFDPLLRDVPYSALVSAVRALLRGYLSEPAASLAVHARRIGDALGPNAKLIAALAPEIELLLGASPDVVPLPPTESQNRLRFVFTSFVRALAPAGRSLVVFLDDLQWADRASLDLVEAIVSDATGPYVLLVGAYRSNEIDETHPLATLRARLLERGAARVLELGPLAQSAVDALVAESLSLAPATVAPLASLVWEKTHGNPFFVAQFLYALVDERLLWFDDERGSWRWDHEACTAKQLTDNVVDLLLARIGRIGADARDVLRFASCIGDRFDRATLAMLSGWDDARLSHGLDEALAESFLVAVERQPLVVSDTRREASEGGGQYRFLHDRVQQVAARLVADDERPRFHLALARESLHRSHGRDGHGRDCDPDRQGAAPRDGSVFEVLRHYNAARALVSDPHERRLVAMLNLDGARRARASGAYATARAMAEIALELLGADTWSSDYATTLALHLIVAEASFLLGDLPVMDGAVEAVLREARETLDAVPAYEIRIRVLTGAYRAREAVQCAADVLGKLGVHLSLSPGKLAVATAVARASWLTRPAALRALRARGGATDPAAIAAIRILASITIPAFVVAADLFPIVAVEIVRVTARAGIAPQSASGYSAWAMVLLAGLGDIPRATAASDFALVLSTMPGAVADDARIASTDGVFVRHYTVPLRDTLEPIRASYERALERGDHETAALAAVSLCSYMLVAGVALDEVERAHERYLAAVRHMRQERFERDFARNSQFIQCITGRAPEPSELRGELFDHAQAKQAYEAQNDAANMSLLAYTRAFLQYLLGDPQAAATLAAESMRDAHHLGATAYRPAIEMLHALAHARLAQTGSGASTRALRRSLRRLQKWSRYAPGNNDHRVALVAAEIARLEGRTLDAISGYERAVTLAGRNRYTHERAVAHECAARFCLAVGEERIARGHLEDARSAYMAWGATAKVLQLEREFVHQLTRRTSLFPAAVTDVSSTSQDTVPEQLDLHSVMMAAQAVSGEIVLEQLLRRLLTIVIESAGAERGVLVLRVGDELRIAAEGRVGQIDIATGDAPALGEHDARLAVPVVNYVVRTRETVLLADARSGTEFSRDPYVATGDVRSVLCVPLLVQGDLTGALYLENNLTPGAFTADRAEVLRALAGQAAISLQNARLYDELQRALEYQTKLSLAQERFVPVEFLQSLNRSDIIGVSLGENVRKHMSVLFSDIRGFTALVEGMSPPEHIGFINTYISYMEPPIIANGGFVDSYIGDAIMALFDGSADAAVRAGVEMSIALQRMNLVRTASGLAAVRTGIGINSGDLTLGTIGGPMRVKCGVIGDAVNLAARVESLTKTYDATLLVSHHTRDSMRDPGAFEMRQIDRVVVKGKTTPVTLYEVLDADPPALRDAKRRTSERLVEAMELYYSQRFGQAASLFDECARESGGDAVASRFRERAVRHAASGVQRDWSGVELLDQK